MPFFNENIDNLSGRVDWNILQNGWANLYWNQEILNKDLNWFSRENYEIISLDCSNWTKEDIIHKSIKKQLSFPDYYGENLAALNDCLSDLKISENGTVFVFRQFQVVNKDFAHFLLDVFANNSRIQMLFGKKIILLIQVEDPRYQIQPIGACPILWNNSEWFDKARGL